MARKTNRRKPAGRPTKYRTEYVNAARAMTHAGLTEYEIAQALGVRRETLWAWGKVHPDFLTALKFQSGDGDERVERSLFHKATGYTHDAVELFQIDGEIVEHPVRKHIPPDTASAIFWLKNRKPEQWRDRLQVNGKVQHDVSGSVEHVHTHLHARIEKIAERLTDQEIDVLEGVYRKLAEEEEQVAKPSDPSTLE